MQGKCCGHRTVCWWGTNASNSSRGDQTAFHLEIKEQIIEDLADYLDVYGNLYLLLDCIEGKLLLLANGSTSILFLVPDRRVCFRGTEEGQTWMQAMLLKLVLASISCCWSRDRTMLQRGHYYYQGDIIRGDGRTN